MSNDCTVNNYINECSPRSTLGVKVAWLQANDTRGVTLNNGLHIHIACIIYRIKAHNSKEMLASYRMIQVRRQF